MEVEIDHRRLAAHTRLFEHGACGAEIARQRFFRKNRLAQLERTNRDLRLQARQRCDGDRLHVGVLDQSAPVAISLRNIVGACKLGGPRGVAAGECNHLAAGIGSERRQLHGAPVIAPDYPQSDHARSSAAQESAIPGMDLG